MNTQGNGSKQHENWHSVGNKSPEGGWGVEVETEMGGKHLWWRKTFNHEA